MGSQANKYEYPTDTLKIKNPDGFFFYKMDYVPNWFIEILLADPRAQIITANGNLFWDFLKIIQQG